jgi:hypothetical protein
MPTISPAQSWRAETRHSQASFSARDNPQRTPPVKRCASSEGRAGETGTPPVGVSPAALLATILSSCNGSGSASSEKEGGVEASDGHGGQFDREQHAAHDGVRRGRGQKEMNAEEFR